MNSASPQLAEDLSEQQLQAMFTLMQNTTFLWNSFVNLETDKQAFTCPIRQSTYTKIKESLHLLCEMGYFEFNLIYDTASKHHSVMNLEISEIKNNFLTIVRTLALATDPKHPPPNGQNQTETPASIYARRQIAKTQPLTRPAQATWPMPAMILKKWPSKPFWYVIVGGFTLLLGFQWFNWLPPPLDAVDKESGQINDTQETLDLTLEQRVTYANNQSQMSLDLPSLPFFKARFPPNAENRLFSTAQKRVRVTVQQLNLYEKPSFQGSLLKQLAFGVHLEVNWMENGWLHVTDPDMTMGWVTAYATMDFNPLTTD